MVAEAAVAALLWVFQTEHADNGRVNAAVGGSDRVAGARMDAEGGSSRAAAALPIVFATLVAAQVLRVTSSVSLKQSFVSRSNRRCFYLAFVVATATSVSLLVRPAVVILDEYLHLLEAVPDLPTGLVLAGIFLVAIHSAVSWVG